MTISKHYTNEREEREANIRSIGEGEKVAVFEVDRVHRNGPELHEITTTGIIRIFNKNSGKLITKLIARPGQIARYYKGNAPQELIDKAYENLQLGFNY